MQLQYHLSRRKINSGSNKQQPPGVHYSLQQRKNNVFVFLACFMRRWKERREGETWGRSISPASCFSRQTTQLHCVFVAVLRSCHFNGLQSTHTHTLQTCVCVCDGVGGRFYPPVHSATHTHTHILCCYVVAFSCVFNKQFCRRKAAQVDVHNVKSDIVRTLYFSIQHFSRLARGCRGSSWGRGVQSQPHIFSSGLIYFLTLQNLNRGWAALFSAFYIDYFFIKGWASFCTVE